MAITSNNNEKRILRILGGLLFQKFRKKGKDQYWGWRKWPDGKTEKAEKAEKAVFSDYDFIPFEKRIQVHVFTEGNFLKPFIIALDIVTILR